MSKTNWKTKITAFVQRLQNNPSVMQPEEFARKFSVSIFAGFMTGIIGMTLVHEINWLFVVPLSVAALLVLGAQN